MRGPNSNYIPAQVCGNSQINIALQICRESFFSKRRSLRITRPSIYMTFPSPVLDCVTFVRLLIVGQPKVKWPTVMHEKAEVKSTPSHLTNVEIRLHRLTVVSFPTKLLMKRKFFYRLVNAKGSSSVIACTRNKS